MTARRYYFQVRSINVIECIWAQSLTASLRAAADQVVPESGKFLSPGTAGQIRAGFLAIAAELDPTTENNDN